VRVRPPRRARVAIDGAALDVELSGVAAPLRVDDVRALHADARSAEGVDDLERAPDEAERARRDGLDLVAKRRGGRE
jgi:hypothetical protein